MTVIVTWEIVLDCFADSLAEAVMVQVSVGLDQHSHRAQVSGLGRQIERSLATLLVLWVRIHAPHSQQGFHAVRKPSLGASV